MKKYLLVLFLSVSSFGATITVDTNTYGITKDAILRAITNAVDGDIVHIPGPGSYIFTNYYGPITKEIMFIGDGTNGANATILVDKTTTSRVSMTAALFYFEITKKVNRWGLANMQFTTDPSVEYPGTSTNLGSQVFRIHSLSPLMTVTNNYFNCYSARPAFFVDYSSNTTFGGVWYGNAFNNPNDAGGFFFDCGSGSQGDNGWNSWATDVPLGTTNMGVYIEHNRFNNKTERAIMDGRGGCRWVFRFNDCTNVTHQTHEMLARKMPPRFFEAYGNNFYGTSGEAAFLIRMGSGIIFSNFVSAGFPALLKMVYYRANQAAPGNPYSNSNPWGVYNWKNANGTNDWDDNYGVTYDTGTHDGGNNIRLLGDSSKSWAINQWTGYSLIDLTTGWGGLIYTNDATHIWMYDPNSFGVDTTFFTNGHTYGIYRVRQAMGMAGMGKGDRLTSGTDFTQTLPFGYTHNRVEPVYLWNNTGPQGLVTNTVYSFIINGLHYTNNTVMPGYAPLPDPHPLVSNNPYNPPTISEIPDQTILQNTSTTNIAFTIGDVETPAGSLTLSKACDNTSLLPTANIAFGGSNLNRTVQCTPTVGQFGSANVTVTVTDGSGFTASTVFLLTVVQTSNSIPIISIIANQTLATNSNTGLISFTVFDVETPATNLVVTSTSSDTNCIPNSFVLLAGTSTNRTVNIFSTNLYGNSTITLSVSDGTTNATSAFIANIPSPLTNRVVKAGQLNVGRLIFIR